MKQITKTLAGRLSRNLLLWLLAILFCLSFLVFYFSNRITHEFYSESYYNRTLINKEYTRRVLSDVYVAVTNNLYYLEQNLAEPDSHIEVMRRIVKNGTRVRSCGVSFIEDYYYPQKQHRFCPYAWRNLANLEEIETIEMGDAAQDYLQADWFRSVIDSDSAQWSEPFYDGADKKTTLTAYMAPVHDPSGRVVAVLGADVSLDWLTNKLNETDSTINANASFASKLLGEDSRSFIINHDGLFITHHDAKRIMEDSFFSHIGTSDADEHVLVEKIKRGMSDTGQGGYEECLFDGQKSYVFYTPVKYTGWVMVTVVPWKSVDTIGIIYGLILLLLMAFVMMLLIAVCYYSLKYVTLPLTQMRRAVNHIAKGKFDTPMPEVRHDDEISQLRDSLGNLQYSLSCYANDKKTDMSPETEGK